MAFIKTVKIKKHIFESILFVLFLNLHVIIHNSKLPVDAFKNNTVSSYISRVTIKNLYICV